jgi:hypothetical protein
MIYGARLKYWAWLFVAMFMLLISKCSHAAITDGKFGVNQIFDVQYYWSGTTLNASSFIAPYDKNFQTVTVSSGQYFQFFASTTNPGSYGLGLYNSNGSLAKVVHDYGDITALGSGAIFYIGSGFFGNVISTSQGYSYGASATFTNMDTSVSSTDLSSYTWASTTPLASGQTAAPPAPAPTTTCNPCSPQGTNLGFESGTTANWTISNGTGTEKTSGWSDNGDGVNTSKGMVNYQPGGGKTWTITPYGTWMMSIQAGGDSPTFDQASASLGLTPTQVQELKTFLANQGGNSNPTNASWAKRTVTLEAGKKYVVAWQYLSTDYVPFNDGSMMTLTGPSLPKLNNENKNYALLGFTNPGTGNYSTDSYGATGWQLATIEVTVSGDYTLGFASFNLGDTALSPILVVDDLQGTTTLNGTVFQPIPPNPGSSAPTTGGGGSTPPPCPNSSTCSTSAFTANTGFNNRATVWSQQTGSKVIIEQIGNYNVATVQQTGNKNYAEIDLTGSNNTTSITQSTSGATTTNYIEALITGNSNTVNLTQSSTGGTKGIMATVDNSGNNLTVNQSGTGNHYTEVSLTGGNKSVDITQSGTVGHMAKVELSGGATAMTLTQQGSTQQFYSITHSCAQISCAAITVTQGQ